MQIYSTILDKKIPYAIDNPKEILGGKAAGVFDMIRAGLPVPPAFTIPTTECMAFLNGGKNGNTFYQYSALVDFAMGEYTRLGDYFGYYPLVSVRSGARVSMPGMMDTILNVGLTKFNLEEWKKRIGERTALDSYRRLIQMYGCVVNDIPHAQFEHALHREKQNAGVTYDSELPIANLEALIEEYHQIYLHFTSDDFPNEVELQISGAIQAVFKSWNNERAIAYRKLNNYPDDWGTAVTIQAMVFGNFNENSCSGVLFTRCPSTGQNAIIGEFLPNAQGEDVVAGIRTPVSWEYMADWNPLVYEKIRTMVTKLELHYKDMQDIEFTVQDGHVFLLQTRNGKRSARASFVIACDLWKEGVIDFDTVCKRVTAKEYMILHRPMIDPNFKEPPTHTGIAGGGGVVTGIPVFSAASAINCKEPCILVAKETTPDDVEGMNASLGILTLTGGKTSHAAVVARGMNKTCVVGCTDLDIPALVGINSITLDGHTGNVWVNIHVPVIKAIVPAEADRIIDYAFKLHKPLLKTNEIFPDVCGGIYIASSEFETASGTIKEELEELLCRVLDEGHNAVVDLQPKSEYLPESDTLIEYIAETPPNPLLVLENKMLILNSFKGSKAISLIPPANLSPMHKKKLTGYYTIGVLNTLDDAFNATSGMIKIVPEKIKTVFGTKKAFDNFLDVMATAGKPLTPYTEAVTPNEAIFQILS